MQWRELEIKSVSYTSLFEHVQRWIDDGLNTSNDGVIHETYKAVLSTYASAHDEKYYIVHSSQVKNMHGRCGLGRSPVDRGREGLKVSILTYCNAQYES